MSKALRPEAAGTASPASGARLTVPGLAGAIGTSLVVLGTSEAGSPFGEHLRGSWFLTLGSPSSAGERTFGVLCTYAGLTILAGAWLRLLADSRRRAGSLRQLRLLLTGWIVPLVVAPPLFSRDAYAYLADGQLVSTGGNPYSQGPAGLRHGRLLELVDPLWRHVAPPYGPGFERLVASELALTGHGVVAGLLALRLDALVAMAALSWAVPAICRRCGAGEAQGLIFAVANPLVLLTFVGGLHNDALMLALVACGVALAGRGHARAGTLLCALGAEVKLPALLAVVFVAFWSGAGRSAARRITQVAAHLLFAVILLGAIGTAAGLGEGYVAATLTPGRVVSWLDPATASGLLAAHLGSALGLGSHQSGLVAAARVVALGLAALVALALLARSAWGWLGPVRGPLRSPPGALGAALLVLALLGPVVWPWYESWGIVLLGSLASELPAGLRRVLVALSLLGCVADLPAPRDLAGGPLPAVLAGWTALAVLVAAGIMTVRRAGRSEPRALACAGGGMPAPG